MERWREALGRLPAEARRQARDSIRPIIINDVTATLLATPALLDAVYERKLRHATESFVEASARLESHGSFCSGSRLYDRLYESLSEDGKKLIDSSPRVDYETAKNRFRRLDGFMTSSGIQIIEMNQSAPLAISFYERARAYHAALGGNVRSYDLYGALAEWFLQRIERPHATVAVSIENGYPAKKADLPIAVQGISQASVALRKPLEFIAGNPEDFAFDNDVPTVRARRFDMLWRNTVYLRNHTHTEDYEKIRYSPATNMVNDLQAWLLRSKEFMAMIWDDSLRVDFEKCGVNTYALRNSVPYTVTLRSYHPNRIANRSQYVLKRCDDGFGRGIVFGGSLTDDEWNKFINGAHGYDWVIQENVAPYEAAVSYIDDTGEVCDIKANIDLNPYVVNGHVAGYLMRAIPCSKKDTVMNIVEGAMIGFAGVGV